MENHSRAFPKLLDFVPKRANLSFSLVLRLLVDAQRVRFYHELYCDSGVAPFCFVIDALEENPVVVSGLVATYLFLGGVGAGAFVLAAILDFANARRAAGAHAGWYGGVARRGFAASFALLVLGVLCLSFDLGRPDRLFLLFLSPTLSFLTSGAYALALLITCAFALAFLLRSHARKSVAAVRKALLFAGALISLYVMVYTGLLLRSVNVVPLWDSAFLPVLFVLSSLVSGVACTVLCARLVDNRFSLARHFERRMATVDAVLLMLEAFAAAAYVASAIGHPLGLEAVRRLLFGDVSPLFLGGFCVCGLLLPALLDVVVLRGQSREWMTFAAALLSLAGCFCLRLGLVAAGVHSAVG